MIENIESACEIISNKVAVNIYTGLDYLFREQDTSLDYFGEITETGVITVNSINGEIISCDRIIHAAENIIGKDLHDFAECTEVIHILTERLLSPVKKELLSHDKITSFAGNCFCHIVNNECRSEFIYGFNANSTKG